MCFLDWIRDAVLFCSSWVFSLIMVQQQVWQVYSGYAKSPPCEKLSLTSFEFHRFFLKLLLRQSFSLVFLTASKATPLLSLCHFSSFYLSVSLKELNSFLAKARGGQQGEVGAEIRAIALEVEEIYSVFVQEEEEEQWEESRQSEGKEGTKQ